VELKQSELTIRDLMYEYADKGLVTIPVNEKTPTNNGWQLTKRDLSHERIDNLFNTKFKEVTGLAVLVTSANPGLACVDIDTDHVETIDKIVNSLPSHINKHGKKGCSFFFYSTKEIGIFKFPCEGGFVEVFYNKYVVLPPSLHSRSKLGDHNYVWVDEGCTLLSISDYSEDLPFIELSDIEALCGDKTVKELNANRPIQLQYDVNGMADGRYDAIGKVIGSYIKRKSGVVNISEITEAVLKFDAENFSKNSFFLYVFNKKHKEIKQGSSRELNAMAYVQALLVSIEKREKLYFSEALSSPSEVFDPNGIHFREFVELKKSEDFKDTFDLDYIPPMYRNFCKRLSDSFGTSLQSSFFPLLAAHAGVLQSKFIIRPKRGLNFFQRPNLGVILLANSGSKKSDIVKMVMWKNNQLDLELKDCNPKELLEKQMGLTKRIESQTKNKNKAYELGNFDEAEQIKNEIYTLQDELTELCKGIKPTVWLYHSATVQKIIKDHSDNHKNGLFFKADEFQTYLSIMQKKGNEEFRTYMMEALNGDGSYTSSTLSRGTDHIEQCYASVLSTLQPDVFKVKVDDIHNPRMCENDGFWQRYIFINMGRPTLDRIGDFNVMDFKKEYDLFEHGHMLHPREIHVNDNALNFYDECLRILELKADRYFGKPVGSFLAKHQGRLCKYALLAEWFLSNGRCTDIGIEALQYAMVWLEYEGNSIIHQFNIGKNDDDYNAITRIIERIETGILVDGETASKWQFECRGIFRSMDQFTRYLKILENHGYISLIEMKANSKIVKINPIMRSYASKA